MSDFVEKQRRLLELISSYGSCAVAFSGGVDSAVVAKAAQMALGEAAVAVTGVSSSLAAGELEAARRLAREIGIRHVELPTQELTNPEYVANAGDRCFHCKTELYTVLEGIVKRLGVTFIVNGANADDLGDYRPGHEAAHEHGVRSPLAECGFTKMEIRELALDWQLPVWDKPATPCLSSRIAYGVKVTPERLEMIDRAEQYLRSLGLREVRVRYHEGDLARVEVAAEELGELSESCARAALVCELRSIGFKFVTLDLEGFRSGSLNSLIQIRELAAGN